MMMAIATPTTSSMRYEPSNTATIPDPGPGFLAATASSVLAAILPAQHTSSM